MTTKTSPAPLSVTVPVAAKMVGLSADTLARHIHATKNPLPAKKSAPNGGKFLIRVADLEAWFDGLEDA